MKRLYAVLGLVLGLTYAMNAQVIINEVLYDPSNDALAGDANGDGVYEQEEDAFIEFVNTGSSYFDMSGYEIWDDTATGSLQFTFPEGTIVPPMGALVVFGGGTPTGDFGGAIVLVDTSSNGLSLQNSGEIIMVKDNNGNVVLTFDSDALSNNPNESYTRNPDITGDFEQHADNTTRLFSPGRTVDSATFAVPMHLQGVIDFDTPEAGATGKAIHIVADSAISDLSFYGIGVANNGGGTDGRELDLPAISVNKGDDILIARDSQAMVNFLAECASEIEVIIVDDAGEVNMNGDDAIEFFLGSHAINTYGDPDVDGTGEPWEYSESWAYLMDGTWITGDLDCTQDKQNIYYSSCKYPICPDLDVTAISITTEGGLTAIDVLDGALQLYASTTPAYATDTTVTWSVDDDMIATVDANGLLTAVADGTVEVTATANDGSGVTASISITISNQTTSVHDLNPGNIKMYPNPTSSSVSILSDQHIEMIKVYDLSGKLVYEVKPLSSSINLSELGNGVYQIEVLTSQHVSRLRLIKQ